jgi:hypothetical protein
VGKKRRAVVDNNGDEAFDGKNIDTLKGLAEFLQAIVTVSIVGKIVKPILFYLFAGLSIWATFNSGVVTWVKSVFS